MPFEINAIPVESYAGVTIQNQLAGEGSQRLVVLLPGVGYTVYSPLFHYLRTIILSKGDDVLSVKYGFQVAQTDYSPMNQAEITAESQKAIEGALSRGYDDLVIIGKSLGTPMAAVFANHFKQCSKLLLLTPIQKCHDMVERTPTLAIIGTEDKWYNETAINDSMLVNWKIYEGLNHSLEVPGNAIASIQVMQIVMQACSYFLYDG